MRQKAIKTRALIAFVNCSRCEAQRVVSYLVALISERHTVAPIPTPILMRTINPIRLGKKLLPLKLKRQIKKLFYCILLKKKFVHFIHVSRTGGTAVKVTFQNHRETKNYVLEFHNHRVKLKDIPTGEKIVFFVRDPVTRFVSGFYTRWRCGRPRNNTPWSPNEEKAFRQFDTPNKLAVALSSEDANERESAIKAMKNIRHVNSSFWDWFENESYFLSRREDIFFFGFQENLQEDFERLKSKLGTPETVILPTDGIQTHRTPPGLDTTLVEEAVTNIKAWYARDYDFILLCKKLSKEMS